MEAKHGRSARDDVWEHPDLAPQSADLDDPLGYVERFGTTTSDDFDAELAKLLGGESDGTGSPDDRPSS